MASEEPLSTALPLPHFKTSPLNHVLQPCHALSLLDHDFGNNMPRNAWRILWYTFRDAGTTPVPPFHSSLVYSTAVWSKLQWCYSVDVTAAAAVGAAPLGWGDGLISEKDPDFDPQFVTCKFGRPLHKIGRSSSCFKKNLAGLHPADKRATLPFPLRNWEGFLSQYPDKLPSKLATTCETRQYRTANTFDSFSFNDAKLKESNAEPTKI